MSDTTPTPAAPVAPAPAPEVPAESPATTTATQVKHPWRATARTVFQALVGAAAMAPLVYEGATQHSPAEATGAVAVGLGVCAGLTRVMALPPVDRFIGKFLPFLASTPKQ